ncbi:glycoside hydrolase superfamily [Aspergillus falconensis]
MALKNRIIIPGWHIQNTEVLRGTVNSWSLPHADVSNWTRIGPRGTVMGGLLDSRKYDEETLFASDALSMIRSSHFQSPWLFREEFSIPELDAGYHVFLNLHGVSSKADVFINGQLVVSSGDQKGAYAGRTEEVTAFIRPDLNCLLIQAWPTDYLKDLAISFADWNPAPPDSGMGVWRYVGLTITGPVSVSPLRVTYVQDEANPHSRVTVTVKSDVANHGSVPQDVAVHCQIVIPGNSQNVAISQRVYLLPNTRSTIAMETTLEDGQVQIWWPAAWGQQPLYRVDLNVSLPPSFKSHSAWARFGIRRVEYKLNDHGDGQFFINGRPFQVRGAGYAPDIFLRFDAERVERVLRYAVHIGLNTIRLEGKLEHAALYRLADRLGLMVMAGWECCDKWEGWTYNEDVEGVEVWKDEDYGIGEASMLHEAEILQTHPCVLAFLLGSDYWPDKRATAAYLKALNHMDWQNPIIASASKRGHPPQLPLSGMKMEGPYDWVPPSYWWGDQLGAAFGFASEVSAGAGTPELSSLRRFLSDVDLATLWSKIQAGQYHQAPKGSVFHGREIYNKALKRRYGSPTSLEDYVFKCQVMDYEATRAQFEAFAARQNAARPATGVIYWMLNSAWPSLHWQLFDYYLYPMGAYYGAKVGARPEHVVLDYQSNSVYLINHSLSSGSRRVTADYIDARGRTLYHREESVETAATTSKEVFSLPEVSTLATMAFLRLVLSASDGEISRHVYWLNGRMDKLDWENSTWYYTPTTRYADFTALSQMEQASMDTIIDLLTHPDPSMKHLRVRLRNLSSIPAFFICLTVHNVMTGEEIRPVFWSDNYVTLFPGEQVTVTVGFEADQWRITMKGSNVLETEITG